MICLVELLLRNNEPTQANVTVKNTQSLMSRVYTYDALPDNDLCVYSGNNCLKLGMFTHLTDSVCTGP